MTAFIQHLIAAPVFPQDEEKTRVARLLNAVIWFNLFLWVLTLFALPLTATPLLGLGVVGGLILIGSLALYALKIGRVELIARLFVAFLWAATTGLVAVSGGIHNPETAGFVIAILVTGLLSGVRSVFVYTVLSLLASLAIYWAEEQGLLITLLPVQPFVALLATCLNVLLAASLVYLALSGITRALRSVQHYARVLEQERASLEQRVAERTQAAETARRQAEIANQALEVEVWQNKGLIRLNEALREEQEVECLAGRALDVVCHHLQAPVGAVFLLIEDHLKFAGGYAHLPDAQTMTTYRLGEGLLGQAALDQHPIVVEQIPADCLTVTSGLGNALPSRLAIWPLQNGGILFGALEVGLLEDALSIENSPFPASVASLPAAQAQFLDRAAENIAIALQTAYARRRITELRLETQAQAEELQAREEELRAMNDELQVQAKR